MDVLYRMLYQTDSDGIKIEGIGRIIFDLSTSRVFMPLSPTSTASRTTRTPVGDWMQCTINTL